MDKLENTITGWKGLSLKEWDLLISSTDYWWRASFIGEVAACKFIWRISRIIEIGIIKEKIGRRC